MIPHQADQWITHRWTRSKTRFFRALDYGALAPRTLYNRDRDTHEIAHLIVVTDELVDDPTWGMPHFIRGDEKLSATDFEIEITVDAIAKVLFYATTIDEEFLFPTMTRPWRDWASAYAMVLQPYGPFTYKEVKDKYQQAFDTWTVEACWTELQRKYRIWDDRPLQPR